MTAELILRSPQYMSCIKQYEIDLRGNKIGAIENLGATENQFDSIDLSDNAIVRLEGFPKLPRLKTLLLNNNKIVRVAKNLEEAIPNLEMLILTNNKLAELKDLDMLGTLQHLTHLSLLDNPVTKRANYRSYVISKLPHLTMLDYRKVKQKERELASQTAAAAKANRAVASAAAAGNTFEPSEDFAAAVQQPPGGEEQPDEMQTEQEQQQEAAEAVAAAAGGGPMKLTADQTAALQAAIANVQTLEEVRRIEEALKSGYMPSGFSFGADGEGGGAAAAAADGAGAAPMDQG